MNKYSFSSCVLLIFAVFSCKDSKITEKKNVTYPPQGDSALLNERAILKKHAFCKCLITNFPTDTSLINDGTLMGYIETGSYGNKAYDIIDSFISKKSLVKYNSKHHHDLYLMKCIDIYNCIGLDSVVQTLDIYLNRNVNQDDFSK
jgi:hypothetical protein